ncbi:ATP-binding protein [Teredinibacter turnerae]|uniref:ATP-binding protein n=1 Tax=Teredinibacter turnerae TaxID=2426 RepID=UPI0003640D77|nr:ATP-binding protein [Teredinibacter turnerae]
MKKNGFLEKYEEIFTPSAPMEDRELFFGREQELVDFKRGIRRKGLHPVVIGHRGVGKTSLVKMALHEWDETHTIIRVTCNARMSFHEFAASVLEQLGVDRTEIETIYENAKSVHGKAGIFSSEIGTSGNEKTTVRKAGENSVKYEPWGLYSYLASRKDNIIVVLDEYDRINSNNKYSKHFHENVADLMKTLADNAEYCTTKLVVVGISQSAQKLLGEHESIERSAREIYIRPLRQEDINDFLTSTEQDLNFSFHPAVKESIIQSSNGYPYYVHLVSLQAIDAMIDRDKSARSVSVEDFENGIVKAVEEAFRSVLRKYQGAVNGLKERELIFIEKFCYYPLNRDVYINTFRDHMQRRNIMGGQEFDSILTKLTHDQALFYTSRNSGRLRFVEPLMGAFLKSKIFKIQSGRNISKNQLDLEL